MGFDTLIVIKSINTVDTYSCVFSVQIVSQHLTIKQNVDIFFKCGKFLAKCAMTKFTLLSIT